MNGYQTYLSIALGSALGGVARFWVSAMIATRFGDKFPLGTLLVNISGCFLIGLFAAWTATGKLDTAPQLRHFLMVGVCGGYTTFSAFSLQTFELLRAGQWLSSATYICGSFLLCLVGTWLGYSSGAAVFR